MPKYDGLPYRGSARPPGQTRTNRRSQQAMGLVAHWSFLDTLWIDDVDVQGVFTNPSPTTGTLGRGFSPVSTWVVLNKSLYVWPEQATDPWTMHCVFEARSSLVSLSHVWGMSNSAPVGGGLVSDGATVGFKRSLIQYNNHYYFWGDSADWDTGVAWVPGRVEWLTITHDGASLRFYRNGVLAAGPQARPGQLADMPSVYVVAGARHQDGTTGPTGVLYSGSIYNRALSDQQVWALYDPRTNWDLCLPA